MFQTHVVIIRMATRQKISTQLFKTLYSTLKKVKGNFFR